jgi:hypothetical protein
MRFNLDQFKQNFYEEINNRKLTEALSLIERCTGENFKDAEELINLKRFKESCDIAIDTFDSILKGKEEIQYG